MAPVPDGNRDDPNNRNEDVSDMETPQFNVTVDSDTSSDEGEPHDLGYVLLPQDPEISITGDHESDNAEIDHQHNELPQESGDTPVNIDTELRTDLETEIYGSTHLSPDSMQVPPIANAEAEERRDIWNISKPSSSHNIVMDKEHVQKIKSVMANINLPTPDWAKAVPEEEWKKQLFSRLQQQSPENSTETQSKVNSERHSSERTLEKNSNVCTKTNDHVSDCDKT